MLATAAVAAPKTSAAQAATAVLAAVMSVKRDHTTQFSAAHRQFSSDHKSNKTKNANWIALLDPRAYTLSSQQRVSPCLQQNSF